MTFVSAMMNLLQSQDTLNISYYTRLGEECSRLTRMTLIQNNNKSIRSPRDSFSNNSLLNEEDVRDVLSFMSKTLCKYTTSMKSIKDSNIQAKMELYINLRGILSNKITGLSDYTGTEYMITLSSLTGFLPLNFYVNRPIQASRESSYFIQTKMKFVPSKSCSLVEWNFKMCKQLETHFSKEFTPNMFDNAISILSISKRRDDLFYYLPWYNGKKFTSAKVQLCFRIVGNHQKKWQLKVFNGKKNYVMFSEDKSTTDLFNIKWKKGCNKDISMTWKTGVFDLYKL